MVTSESMRRYGFHIVEMAPKQFPWNSKTQTMLISWGDFHEMAAFKFYSSQGDHVAIVLFRLQRGEYSTDLEGLVQILENQGDDTLDGLLEREFTSTDFFSNHSMPLETHRSSANEGTRLTVKASVKEEEIFNRRVFVLEVRIEEDPL
jgi:hypothetical protein